MKRNYKSYLDMMGMYPMASVSTVSDVLRMALKDGVTELVIDDNEYQIICHFMIYSAVWNWDKETFMGIKFIKEK